MPYYRVRLSSDWLSTAFYLVMGWLVMVGAGPLIELVPDKTFFLLVAGGVS